MTESINLLIGIVVLVLGFPLGHYLAKYTKEEIKSGRKWFKLLIVLSFVGAIAGLIFRDDAVLFSFLFIVIVTIRSLKRGKK
ncbi:MAG TPA: hypothetical protein ENH99_00880 [Candidatus Pacearchaeota archaeon]|nr:hypothetical protein [Candidatus Pacearchaeota archaeon]